MRKYSVAEIFATIQGEGSNTGRRAVFVRLAGCNIWTGRERDRDRDAGKNSARCARFCDTDFGPRFKYSAEELSHQIAHVSRECGGGHDLVVFTGGEPLLQLNEAAIDAAQQTATDVAIETNGTVAIPPELRARIWVTLSPKQPFDKLVQRECDDLKLVWPSYSPHDYADIEAKHRYLQPEAAPGQLGLPLEITRRCASLVSKSPGWRLSVQTHKIARLP